MSNKVVIVTGCTGAIGKAIAKQVVARDEPITFLATSRQGTDIGLTPSHPDSKVEYPKLDLTSDTSISALRELVKAKCGGVVDVMILNAGGDFESGEDSTYGPEAALKTFDLNYYGNSRMMDAFLPHMHGGGRVVVLSSGTSWQVKFDNQALYDRAFSPTLSREELDQMAKEFIDSTKSPQQEGTGWLKTGYKPMYATSKAFLNLLVGVEARKRPDVLVSAVCPGIVDTGVPNGLPFKLKTPEQGSQLPLRCAFDEIGGVNGKFWNGTSTASLGPGVVVDDWAGKEIVWDMP